MIYIFILLLLLSIASLYLPLKRVEAKDRRVIRDSHMITECTKSVSRLPSSLYTDEDVLGTGGFGSVFAVTDVRSRERFAVKILSKTDIKLQHADIDNLIIKSEVTLLQRVIQHENIVKLHKVLESEEKVFMVMELCSEGDLYHYTRDKGVLSEDHAKLIMRQIVSAVEYLHDLGIVHRDIKLRNIFMKSRTEVKLGDFGLAEWREPRNNFGYKNFKYEKHMSSRLFKAPELISIDETFSFPVDVFALGVVLFTLLCGDTPFGSDFEALKNPVIIPNGLSSSAKDLISAMLTKDQRERITIHAVAEHSWFRED